VFPDNENGTHKVMVDDCDSEE